MNSRPEGDGGNRHHRHHRHRPSPFNGLGVTEPISTLSPGALICVTAVGVLMTGDRSGDGGVTVIIGIASPHKRLELGTLLLANGPGDDGDARLPLSLRHAYDHQRN